MVWKASQLIAHLLIAYVTPRHGVNSILELIGNSGFGIAYLKNGIDKFGIVIEVCYKKLNPQINLPFTIF